MKQTVVFFLGGIILALVSFNLTAQTTNITGKIIDSETKSPLSYASVRIKEKPLGTVADGIGDFTLTLSTPPESYTLVVSFIGFQIYEIKLIEFIEGKDKTIRLQAAACELEAITISEEKFNVNKFMAKVIQTYQSSAPKTPHIAQAYFQEKISLNGEQVLFTDGFGYTVYMGNVGNLAARSNYKFFYEQVSVNRNFKPWTDHVAKLGKTNNHIFGGSNNLNNFRTFELSGPLSENGKKFKFKLRLDSGVFHQGESCLLINFKGADQSGWLKIGEETLRVWEVNYDESNNIIWSTAYHDRVKGYLTCVYDYYKDQHYLSEATSLYMKGDIIHWSFLKVVSQKFDKLELSGEEYWEINAFDQFAIGQGKESKKPFQPYNFYPGDPRFRAEFKQGFINEEIDPEKNPGYQELLTKLRSFF